MTLFLLMRMYFQEASLCLKMFCSVTSAILHRSRMCFSHASLGQVSCVLLYILINRTVMILNECNMVFVCFAGTKYR